jgi:hypothetical protein
VITNEVLRLRLLARSHRLRANQLERQGRHTSAAKFIEFAANAEIMAAKLVLGMESPS